MGRGQYHDEVTTELKALQSAYESPAVRQTTMTVPAPEYDRVAGECERTVLDACVRIHDGDRLLLCEGEGELSEPTTTVGRGERAEAALRRCIADRAGVDCRITGLNRLTIVGVTDADDEGRPPVYRLTAVFDAEYLGGTPGDAAEWCEAAPGSVAY